MDLYIPKKENIRSTTIEDSVKCYYHPILKYPYLRRFKEVKKLIGKRKFNKLLDLGYGSGIFLPELAKHTEELHGLDIHSNQRIVEEMLKKENTTAKLSHGDIADFSEKYGPRFFDVIVCLSVLEHVKEIENAIDNVLYVLKDDGTAFLGFPTKNPFIDLIFNLILSKVVKKEHKIDDFHVSSHNKILDNIKAKMKIEKIVTIPRFIPKELSIYIVCECKKKNLRG